MNTKEKFYKKNWFIYLMLFVFPPVGIILLWIFNRKSTKAKGILTAVSAIWLVIALLTGNSPDNTNDTTTLAENESTIENTIIKNSIEESSTTDHSIVESFETTSLQETTEIETPETESIELSIPESTEDIHVEHESIPESMPEVSTDNSSGNTTQSSDQSANTSNDTETSTATINNFETYNNTEQQNTTAQYVLNTSTRRIHIPSCSSVATIKSENYATSNLSIAELEAQGYQRCGHCLK